MGSPIQCWFPAEFPGGWEEWGEDYCFIQNTYYVAPKAEIPPNPADRKGLEIGYYQWVPIMLALQGLMFYLPHFIWKLLNGVSGRNRDTERKVSLWFFFHFFRGKGGRDSGVPWFLGENEQFFFIVTIKT